MGYSFIAVEGAQDVEFVAALLELDGFKKVNLKSDLVGASPPNPFADLIPRTFPHNDDLYKRVPCPLFLRRTVGGVEDWVAVQASDGESGLVKLVSNAFVELGRKRETNPLSAVGIVGDADDENLRKKFSMLVEPLRGLEGMSEPEEPGRVATDGPILFGVFILPDNNRPGTIEDLLEDAAKVAHPYLFEKAGEYVRGIDPQQLSSHNRRLIVKPAGVKKAILACTASILKPGMSIAVSIDQSRWVTEETARLARIADLARFLRELVGPAQPEVAVPDVPDPPLAPPE